MEVISSGFIFIVYARFIAYIRQIIGLFFLICAEKSEDVQASKIPRQKGNRRHVKLFNLPCGNGIRIHMDYIELMKGFLLSPVETFREVRDTNWGDSLKYYLLLLAINAVLSAVVSLASAGTVWMTFSNLFNQSGLPLPAVAGAGVIFIALMMIIVQFVLVFIGAAWLHLFVYVVGGRRDYLQTLKTVTFGSTPAMLFGWIPFVGLLSGIWSLVLAIFGLRELQDLTTIKAVLAVILALMVIVLIIIAIAAFFFIAYSEITPVAVSAP